MATTLKVVDCQFIGDVAEFMLGDEPVFVLRAKDKLALPIVEEYKRRAIKVHAGNVNRVEKIRRRMSEWQELNPERMKIPD